jgi:succinate dehydrogenase / fumarate reductase cytochrome b subunit
MYRYTVLTSIFHRGTGLVLSLGLLVLVYWLMAVASGPRAYAQATSVLSLGIFKLIFFGLLVAFSYHIVTGVRHLIWDTGHGMEREQAKRSAVIVLVVSVALLVAFGYWAFLAGGHA